MSKTSRPARLAVRATALATAVVFLAAPTASAANQGIVNPGFESGNSEAWGELIVDDWYVRGAYGRLINSNPDRPARTGAWKATLGGYATPGRTGQRITQDITIPGLRVPVLSFWMKTDYVGAPHRLVVTAVTMDNTRTELYTRHNAAGGSGGYEPVTVTFPDRFYTSAGQKVRLEFTHWEEGGNTAPFLIDDVSLEYRFKIARPVVDFSKLTLTPIVP
ncbi:hypothetical protein ACWGB8_31400 [Kitasatospora sp. NPDC054939]